jgi:hypothetical protein
LNSKLTKIMNDNHKRRKEIVRFVGQIFLIIVGVVVLTVIICRAVGWRDGSGYALGLLISGGLTTIVGAILASEPLPGRAGRGRKALEQMDSARREERMQDRAYDRNLFDLFGVAGVLVMGLGVLVYFTFGTG